MLNTIEIQKKDGRVLTLPIYNPTSFQIKDIQGLDPVKANIVTSNFSQIDGVQFQTSRREMRNIIMRLGIDSTDVSVSAQSLRKQLYEFLLPKTDVKIKFIRDGAQNVIVDGMVETFESPLFVKDPEANISILCFDPDFHSDTINTVSGDSIDGGTETSVTYDGDVDSGFVFKLNVTKTVTGFTLENITATGTIQRLYFDATDNPLLANDLLTISTIPGDKYVRVNRAGVSTSYLWALDSASEWVKLYPGLNKIKVNSSAVGVPFTIDYYNKYGGL